MDLVGTQVRTFALVVALAGCDPGVPAILDPPPLPSGVVVDERDRTYPVRGRTVEALGASMAQNGPDWDGEHVWGVAQWRVRWGWRTTSHGGGCRLVGVRVYLVTEVTLPEWRDADTAPAELQVRWEDFITALRAHEYGHRNRAFLAATEVHDALLDVRAPDCLDIGERAEATAREVIERYLALDEEYDRRTLHGRAEGVVWPPGDGPWRRGP